MRLPSLPSPHSSWDSNGEIRKKNFRFSTCEKRDYFCLLVLRSKHDRNSHVAAIENKETNEVLVEIEGPAQSKLCGTIEHLFQEVNDREETQPHSFWEKLHLDKFWR